MLAILSVTLHPPVEVNPNTHVLYAAVIVVDELHDDKFGSAGHIADKVVAVPTVKVEAHVALA